MKMLKPEKKDENKDRILSNLCRTEVLELSEQLNRLSKTAFYVLYNRVKYSNILKKPINDPLGQKIIDILDYKSQSEPGYYATGAILTPSRTRILDDWVSEFLKSNGEALVINLGCGFCTRFERLLGNGLDTKKTVWINVDLPEMINLRKSLWKRISQNTLDLQIQIPQSIFENGWIKEAKKYSDRPILFIIEGVLYYYEIDKVKAFFKMIEQNFKNPTILLTTVHPAIVKRNRNLSDPEYKWTVEEGKEIELLNSNLHLVKEMSFFNKELLALKRTPLKNLEAAENLPKNYRVVALLNLITNLR
ncbi:MAG: class I SAM-dependent methyltransferase [Candidatus Micrarchaeota archaeon]|nr:class I SAM-dependent methyltransferase [Candidatus Micrarchaeota archaeon]